MSTAANNSSSHVSADEILATTLATWVYVLHASGVHAEGDVHKLCAGVDGAADASLGDKASVALVSHLQGLITGHDALSVRALLSGLFGARLDDGLGAGDREARVHRVRRYQFSHGYPWLARIWERQADGTVAPTWLIVERVTDEVTAMDPNPWNDIDEERHLPLADFHVLWELDSCASLSIN